MEKSTDVDVLIIGAGVLGVTLAYWLSDQYDCRVAMADSSPAAGAHTSSRNTGVIHRPYYLDPVKKKVFARTSLLSQPMWKSLAYSEGLPWKPVGAYNVGLDEGEVRTLERYRAWGIENGMDESELELIDSREVRRREPEVSCRAALLSRTDVSVDFGAFTRYLWRFLVNRGVRILVGHRITEITEGDGHAEARSTTKAGRVAIRSKVAINAAGGGSLSIAHSCGLAPDLAALNFRGEYWVVDEPFASKVSSNIYRPPAFPQYPFLDPHFVVRADGSRQIGPNAVAVPGPYVYSGVGLTRLPGFLDRPVSPKGRLFMNGDFLALLAGEWRSSLSKGAMCGRVKKFVPGLDTKMLNRRAVFGVRSSVVGRDGFVPEALILKGRATAHIVNYNSPGATGAPAFSAMVVRALASEGRLDRLARQGGRLSLPGWDFRAAAEGLGQL